MVKAIYWNVVIHYLNVVSICRYGSNSKFKPSIALIMYWSFLKLKTLQLVVNSFNNLYINLLDDTFSATPECILL